MKVKKTFLAKSGYLLQKQKTGKDNTIYPQTVEFLVAVQCEAWCLFSIKLFLILGSLRPQ